MFLCCFLLTVKLFQGIQWILHLTLALHGHTATHCPKIPHSSWGLMTFIYWLLGTTRAYVFTILLLNWTVFLLKTCSQYENLSKLLFLRSKGFYKWPGQTMKKFGEGLMAESFPVPRPATWTENLTTWQRVFALHRNIFDEFTGWEIQVMHLFVYLETWLP